MTQVRTPRYIVRKAPGVGGPPVPEDEPCIVIRAQDRLATSMITYYLDQYEELADIDPAVLVELRAHRQQVIHWQVDNPGKVKWADR